MSYQRENLQDRPSGLNSTLVVVSRGRSGDADIRVEVCILFETNEDVSRHGLVEKILVFCDLPSFLV